MVGKYMMNCGVTCMHGWRVEWRSRTHKVNADTSNHLTIINLMNEIKTRHQYTEMG